MKKYLAILIVLVSTVSCLQGSYKYSYQLATTFETSSDDESIFGIDDIYSKSSLYFDAIVYNSQRDTISTDSTVFTGGFVYARLTDSLLVEKGTILPASEKYTVFDNNADSTTLSTSANHFLLYIQNKEAAKNPTEAIVFTYGSLGTSTCTLTSAYIANTALAVYEAKGLTDLEPISDSDYAKVTFTAFDDNTQTGTAEFELASSGNIVQSWTKWDLSSLGTFDYITVKLTTSRPDIFDTFAMDLVQGEVVIEY